MMRNVWEQLPCISADQLLGCLSAGMIRVTSCFIHPGDVERVDIDGLRRSLGGAAVVPHHGVERGFLYVNSAATRKL